MRGIKGFGLVILVTMAFVGVPAAASAADGLSMVYHPTIPGSPATAEAEEYPSEVTGERYEKGKNVGELVLLDAGGGKASCEAVEIDGGELAEPVEELSLEASYGECSLSTAGATVSMNSCRYEFTGFDEFTGGTYTTDAAIVCDEEGDSIFVDSAGCDVSIPAQDLWFTKLTPSSLGGEDVSVARMKGSGGLEYTLTGAFCPVAVGKSAGTYYDGNSVSHMTLRGFSLVSHPEVPSSVTVDAEEYPSNVVGERFDLGVAPWEGEIVLLDAGGGKASCEVAEIDGGELSEPVEELSFEASYGECSLSTAGATVSMNSCRYELPGFELQGGDTYTTNAAIVCDEEGDSIFVDSAGCDVSIPAQELGAELDPYTLEGEDVVLTGIAGSGLTYTLTGAFCPIAVGKSAGTYEDGNSVSHLTLRGEATS